MPQSTSLRWFSTPADRRRRVATDFPRKRRSWPIGIRRRKILFRKDSHRTWLPEKKRPSLSSESEPAGEGGVDMEWVRPIGEKNARSTISADGFKVERTERTDSVVLAAFIKLNKMCI